MPIYVDDPNVHSQHSSSLLFQGSSFPCAAAAIATSFHSSRHCSSPAAAVTAVKPPTQCMLNAAFAASASIFSATLERRCL